ncbi:MAG: glycosyltransferase [Acutalibacteraceae bacterium]
MKKVLVLLSTYNGEKYLDTQIMSITKQEGVDVDIVVRDDCSKDNTVKLLQDYADRDIIKRFYCGENKGPAMSFWDLIVNAEEGYDYYSLCDQDDFWLPGKLSEAVKNLMNYQKPAMYFSKLCYVDENLDELGKTLPLENYPYDFCQEFLKNQMAGCTSVFNSLLLSYFKKYTPKNIAMHDRWMYLVCLGIGGEIVFDENSYIKYRQHSKNVTVSKSILQKYKARIKRVFGEKQYIFSYAQQLIEGYENSLTKENKESVFKILNYKKNKVKILKDKSFRISDVNDKNKRGIFDSNSNISFAYKVLTGKL